MEFVVGALGVSVASGVLVAHDNKDTVLIAAMKIQAKKDDGFFIMSPDTMLFCKTCQASSCI